MTVFAGLVLVVCMVLVLAWVRSHWVADGVFWKRQRGELRIVSSSGVMMLIGRRPVGLSALGQDVGLGYTRQPPHDLMERISPMRTGARIDRCWGRVGLGMVTGLSRAVEYWVVSVPYWGVVLCLSLGVWPRIIWGPVRRWRRRKQGRCERCGYDLRASKERCPECGEGIVAEGSGIGG
ncbi:MAG: hypothetical protein NTU53_03170 [Planctomycetota bacterium]|nr:hypothetical protein [Planctomycetota bacterium]